MKTASLGLALVLALTGCADSTGAGDEGMGGDGSGSQEPQPEPQMDAQGSFRVNSTFDIATNMPGSTGSFLNGLIDATNSPDDPMSWLVDQMLEGMDDGGLKDALVAVKPFVIGYLNNEVTSLAPDLVNTIKTIGQRMESVMKKFGVNEIWEISSVDQTLVARSTVDGVRFEIAGVTKDYNFVDYDIDNVIINSILITLDKGQERMHAGEHDMPLPWGKVLRLALDVAVIPSIDPTATSLAVLLDHVVDCNSVGSSMQSAIGFGGSTFWAGVCRGGLAVAADQVYNQIVDADAKLDMHLVGSSRYKDLNNDYKIDELLFGNWTGTMKLDAQDATIAQPAAYVGKRMLLTP